MADRVLEGPIKVSGGSIVRVVSRDGNAVPEVWSGTAWEEADGSMLAAVLEGRSLSRRELSELGIP